MNRPTTTHRVLSPHRFLAPALLLALSFPTPLFAASADLAQTPTTTSTSVFEAFFIQRHPETGELELLGTAIIWLLLALSAACVGLIVSVALSTTRPRLLPAAVYDTVRDALKKRDPAAALRAAESDDSYFAAVAAAALYDANAGFSAMIRALEQTSEELTVRRLRRVEPLNVIGNVAPMIGLFGTVYGMILAFREIVAAGGSPDPVGLAQGIGTALTTTFWGLVVAIPALTGYAFLRNKIDALTVEATRDAEELINRYRPDAALNSTADRRPDDHASAAPLNNAHASQDATDADRDALTTGRR
jgi:biopolymer transport protein ExbB